MTFSSRTLRVALVVFGVTLLATSLAAAHDLFLKPKAFFIPPNGSAQVVVLNGTFSSSEGSVTRDRLLDLSVVGPTGRKPVDTSTWTPLGKASTWDVPVGAAGTYLLGASLKPRTIALAAKAFNEYLASDGLPDILEARRKSGELEKPSKERYSKHVKALVQVGDAHTGSITPALGYPAELVPLDNPYALGQSRVLRVRALVDGAIVRNQVVLAGGRTNAGGRLKEQMVRTDSNGVARIDLSQKGLWYVKFIRMVKIPAAKDSVDYESKWATLTFAVR